MPGLHSFHSERTRQNGLTGSPNAANLDAPAPHLRVVTAESEGSDLATSLRQFEVALGRGDLSRARDALLTIRDDQQAERQRIEQEKSELLQAVEDLQQLLDERCRAHEQELVQQKRRLAEWHETEKQNLSTETDQTLAEIQESRDAWEAERAEQAALLIEERSRLDSAAEDLRIARSEVESQHAELADERTELANERTELESELAARRTEFEEELKAEQLERFRVIDAAIAQRESEWSERQRQLEHELASQRKLHEKQLTLDRESFLRACSEREADLDAIRADVDQQRKELVEDRCQSAEQYSETRRQLEQDRTLLQNGLRQMESQLRWVAGSISLSGGPLPDRADGKGNSPSAASLAPPATNAEIAPERVDSGWVGVVVPRSRIDELTEPSPAPELDQQVSEEETSVETTIVEVAEPDESAADRRRRIEDYRSQLNSLQASLSELHAASDDSEETPGADSDEDLPE
jgi:hypothetical protein